MVVLLPFRSAWVHASRGRQIHTKRWRTLRNLCYTTWNLTHFLQNATPLRHGKMTLERSLGASSVPKHYSTVSRPAR